MIPLHAVAKHSIQSTEALRLAHSRTDSTTAAQEKAAKQFENLLALQMVKEMTKTIESTDLFGSMPGAHVYSGMADWQLAEMLSRNAKLGIKEAILRQLESKETKTDDSNLR